MREQSSAVEGGGGTAEADASPVTGGGIAEQDGSTVTGGGGMLEHDSAVRSVAGGGGIAEQDGSAVAGGGGIAEQDGSAVAGGGGITDRPSAVLGGGGNIDPERSGLPASARTYFRASVNASPSSSPESEATHASDSIHSWCARYRDSVTPRFRAPPSPYAAPPGRGLFRRFPLGNDFDMFASAEGPGAEGPGAEGTVPCNNDLLPANLIDDGERIWLIDYELSGNNDACFELGNIAAESHLSRDGLAELVRAYYGRPRRSKIARAWLLGGLAGMYGWTLWGAIQNGASPIDYDFWGWAMERFEGAARGFTARDFGQLLDEVQHDD